MPLGDGTGPRGGGPGTGIGLGRCIGRGMGRGMGRGRGKGKGRGMVRDRSGGLERSTDNDFIADQRAFEEYPGEGEKRS